MRRGRLLSYIYIYTYNINIVDCVRRKRQQQHYTRYFMWNAFFFLLILSSHTVQLQRCMWEAACMNMHAIFQIHVWNIYIYIFIYKHNNPHHIVINSMPFRCHYIFIKSH